MGSRPERFEAFPPSISTFASGPARPTSKAAESEIGTVVAAVAAPRVSATDSPISRVSLAETRSTRESLTFEPRSRVLRPLGHRPKKGANRAQKSANKLAGFLDYVALFLNVSRCFCWLLIILRWLIKVPNIFQYVLEQFGTSKMFTKSGPLHPLFFTKSFQTSTRKKPQTSSKYIMFTYLDFHNFVNIGKDGHRNIPRNRLMKSRKSRR